MLVIMTVMVMELVSYSLANYIVLPAVFFSDIVDRFDNCRFIANYRQLQSEVDQYGASCDISGNGIIIEYDVATAEDKQSMIAEIMEMIYQLFLAN